MNSFDIAQWADAHSHRDEGAKLFPAGQLEGIQKCATALPCSLAVLANRLSLLSASQTVRSAVSAFISEGWHEVSYT